MTRCSIKHLSSLPIHLPNTQLFPGLVELVAIPQISNGIGVPYSRAYSPALQDHSISMSEFVEFIDNLNIVSTGSPPLKVIDAVGGILGVVPIHWFALAGGLTQALAKVGTAAVSKVRADRYMKRVNEEFFGPRRLRAEIVTVEALGAVLELTKEQIAVQRLEGEDLGVGVLERRMRAVGPYISPTSFDVPSPVAATTVLEKWCERQVRMDLAKREKKFMKGRREVVEKEAGKGEKKGRKSEREYNKEMRKLDAEEDKINHKTDKDIMKAEKQKDVDKAERKRWKEMEKIESEREKVMQDTDRERRKEQERYEKEDKEIEASKKVLWILIQNLDESPTELRQW